MLNEHDNLARSMLHFLSPLPSSRVLVIAGFHTGRSNLSSFFTTTIRKYGLDIDTISEMDTNGERRAWEPERPEEPIGTRNKWMVVAVLKRAHCK
jgi:EEF1A N-terminal glycine/lysine methyltransferase